ncbi:MAG: class I SAM-dependent methyltransferase [Thermodesulfobacteriota bacterium]
MSSISSAPTERFTSRAALYHRYRPSYPPAVLELLREECALEPDSVVADIGSGTGKLTELFLEFGSTVFSVEPNAAMREAAVSNYGGNPRFISVEGAAENTSLPSQSVDLAAVGHSFHWFDPIAARREFGRILRPVCIAALIWNDRRDSSTPFLTDYEALLQKYGTDYGAVNPKKAATDTALIASFFGGEDFDTAVFFNYQDFDFEGLLGRVRSSSYTPAEGEEGWAAMTTELLAIFQKHESGGLVRFEYDTRVYFGSLKP